MEDDFDEDYEDLTAGSTCLASWDCLGFECIFDLTEEKSRAVMAGLAGTDYKPEFNLSSMLLRARYNTQRDPEIWTFNIADGITLEDVRAMAEESPQALVDFIRQNGMPYYQGERHKQRRIIT